MSVAFNSLNKNREDRDRDRDRDEISRIRGLNKRFSQPCAPVGPAEIYMYVYIYICDMSALSPMLLDIYI